LPELNGFPGSEYARRQLPRLGDKGIIEQAPGRTGLDCAGAERDGQGVVARTGADRKAILQFRKAEVEGCDDEIRRALEPFLDTLALQGPVLLEQTPA
jgi:hypothetical protein